MYTIKQLIKNQAYGTRIYGILNRGFERAPKLVITRKHCVYFVVLYV